MPNSHSGTASSKFSGRIIWTTRCWAWELNLSPLAGERPISTLA